MPFGHSALLEASGPHGTHSHHRPWLSLYGVRVQPPSSSASEPVEISLIQQAIPHELMLIVFSYLDPYSLGKAALVCRQWRILHEHPRLWERVCHDTFAAAVPDREALQRLMASQYRFSWKRMFVQHPHLRFDGIYVSRNTYVRTGVVEFTNHKPVHLVSYYRYYRFLPDGTFLYRTSPNVISKAARSLVAALPALLPGGSGGAHQGGGGTQGDGPYGSHGHYAPRLPRGKDSAPASAKDLEKERGAVLAGRYAIRDAKVHCTLVYPNSTSTELRCRLALRCSRPGGHDRLDIESITTFDRELGTEAAVQPQPQDADPDAPAPERAKSHSRGMSPCVFVPWEHIYTSPLNLPAHQMDFMIA